MVRPMRSMRAPDSNNHQPRPSPHPPDPHSTTVGEARKFAIDYYGAFKVLTNVAGKRQYVLYPCGGEPPAEADLADVPLPAGFQRKTFSVPAQKVRGCRGWSVGVAGGGRLAD